MLIWLMIMQLFNMFKILNIYISALQQCDWQYIVKKQNRKNKEVQ